MRHVTVTPRAASRLSYSDRAVTGAATEAGPGLGPAGPDTERPQPPTPGPGAHDARAATVAATEHEGMPVLRRALALTVTPRPATQSRNPSHLAA
jgi:hypothetical protein